MEGGDRSGVAAGREGGGMKERKEEGDRKKNGMRAEERSFRSEDLKREFERSICCERLKRTFEANV